LQALTASPALDEYLSQADCLRALFIALNDESKECRATAVQLVGRLAAWNPAYVAPALRRHLLQVWSGSSQECVCVCVWGGGLAKWVWG
jgi:FKBP12-rapamycin complex-associated protein